MIKKLPGLLFIWACALMVFSACGRMHADGDAAPLPQMPDLSHAEAIDFSLSAADDTYRTVDGEKLNSYYEKTLDHFFSACKFYETDGYSLYSYQVANGSHFATYTNGSGLAHIYWIECEGELNIVTSEKAGAALPPQTPSVTDGDTETTVTQLRSKKDNGMGYVIQLADGSFIIYDGGYADNVEELWGTLITLNGSKQGIVIRAWILTHAHEDHYGCFHEFSKKYADHVSLETLMIAPVNRSDANRQLYLHTDVYTDLANFQDASVLYVHTGMAFRFCNVTLEILFTPDELYIADPSQGEYLDTSIDFNNTSIVSRVYTADYSALFLGDASDMVAYRMIAYFGDYLKSDMCQAAHHGVEDFPLLAYRYIKPSILWYPCSQSLYDMTTRDADVRQALRNSKYTQEIILHDKSRETRSFSTAP